MRDFVRESFEIGRRYCLEVTRGDDGRLHATHPNPRCPVDVAVTERLDRLEKRPPDGPVVVELRGEVIDGRLVGEVIDEPCSTPGERVG